MKKVINSALFIGAHPDDIELGAGGTVCHLVSMGWDVWFCVATSETDISIAEKRKKEAIDAAKILGIKPQKILFLDFPDGNLECNRSTVGKFRNILKENNLSPDVVFTHTASDSHNDHKALHDLTMATFRKKPILTYAIVISLIKSNYNPNIFVDISNFFDQKIRAFKKHDSQLKRVSEDQIIKFNEKYSSTLGFNKTEFFEVLFQEGTTEEAIKLVQWLNDSPFNKFWYTLIANKKLFIIHGVPVYRKNKEWDWATDKDRAGMSLLHRSFSEMWNARNPVEDYSCATPNIENFLANSNILLSGGAVSNTVTRDYFNYFKGIRYCINYSMPNYCNIHIQLLSNLSTYSTNQSLKIAG